MCRLISVDDDILQCEYLNLTIKLWPVHIHDHKFQIFSYGFSATGVKTLEKCLQSVFEDCSVVRLKECSQLGGPSLAQPLDHDSLLAGIKSFSESFGEPKTKHWSSDIKEKEGEFYVVLRYSNLCTYVPYQLSYSLGTVTMVCYSCQPHKDGGYFFTVLI